MQVRSLAITGFRNIGSLAIDFDKRVNIFYGDNGAGKTNLLEAVFLFCLGRSQRGAADGVMVNHAADVYRIEGDVRVGGVQRRLAIAYQKGARKRLSIDEVPIRIQELYDLFCAVSVGPEDSAVLSGPPAVRRGFVDIYLSQYSRRYLDNLTDYARALSQKNAALKTESDPEPFDTLMVRHGSEIIQARARFIRALAEEAEPYYAAVSGGQEFAIKYHPSVWVDTGEDSLEALARAFEARLLSMADRERAARSSLVGPHRDELLFEISGHPARAFGSQGEWRTAAVALKMAVYQLLRRKRGMTPVLLLDEIFAELDEHRSTALIESFDEFGQLFLTTAADPPPSLRERGRSYRITEGTIKGVT